jgi:LysR family transcriptional regulator, transcription activator of glutamate synthase operon
MDWHQLKYFKTLAHFCSFTKASEELVLSQSALSRSILKLEEEIGVPLFQRKSRGVALNQYGEIFLEHTNQALYQIEEAKKEINNMVDPFHGIISLAFIQTLGSSFIPDLIYEFHKQKPNIKFHLTQDTTKNIINRVETAQADIGFCAPQEHVDTLSNLPIMSQELFLIVYKDHPLAGNEQADLLEVAGDPFVLYKPETALRDVIERLCEDAGFNPAMSFEAFEERTIAGLVGAKFGVALIPFIPGLDMDKISLIRIQKPQCMMTVQMVWPSSGYISPAVLNFISFVENSRQ